MSYWIRGDKNIGNFNKKDFFNFMSSKFGDPSEVEDLLFYKTNLGILCVHTKESLDNPLLVIL
jgi:hypothetical protein